MDISPLNLYYFDKSYIADKHDPNHDKRKNLHTQISKIWWLWTPKCVTRVSHCLQKTQNFLLVYLDMHVYNVILDSPPSPRDNNIMMISNALMIWWSELGGHESWQGL